jgi:cytochrome d ubiquinol oxidase subunit I
MPFQFGTNWSRFADATSNVRPLFAMRHHRLFLKRLFSACSCSAASWVPGAHFVAALMVALAALLLVLDLSRQQLDADTGRL